MGAALVVLLVVMLAPAALAVKNCTAYPSYGTDNGEKLAERLVKRSPDKIYALRGDDRIEAGIFIRDRDILFGGRGDDRLRAADVDGKDVVNGGPGFDVCIIDEDELYGKDTTRGCERVRELVTVPA